MRNIPQPPIPSPIDKMNGKEAFKHKAIINNKNAVAGNPHNTPYTNLLKIFASSP
jgi:hypothetical protein